MLYYFVNISRAHWYKKAFLKILDSKNSDDAKKYLIDQIQNAEQFGLDPFEKCAKTM